MARPLTGGTIPFADRIELFLSRFPPLRVSSTVAFFEDES
jgi:hypothetical protein